MESLKTLTIPKIEDTETYKHFSGKLQFDIDFLDKFQDHINFGRRNITLNVPKENLSLNTSLIESSIQTLKSIRLCCSIGSFADANMLIRKHRDDLLLYVYIIDVINKRKGYVEEDIENFDKSDEHKFLESFSKLRKNPHLTNDEKVVEAWLTSKVSELPKQLKFKLSFESYMQAFEKNAAVIKVLSNYKLEKYWGQIRENLNDYVHNNGQQYTYHNNTKSDNQNLETHLNNINTRISYIITFFLILIIIVESAIIAASDIIEYLDLGISPPEGCQYRVANFIQQYIDEKVMPLHPELKKYLIDNNTYGMKIK